MGKIYKYTALVLLLLNIACDSKIDQNEYSKILQIDLPSNMEMLFYENQGNFQDYSVHSIYELSFNQKNEFLEIVIENLCKKKDNSTESLNCWIKYDDFYSYEYHDEKNELTITVLFYATNDISFMHIYEMKL